MLKSLARLGAFIRKAGVTVTVIAVFAPLFLPDNSFSDSGNSKAILIGISQYSDSEGISDLKFADKDVETFSSILTNFGGYEEREVDMMLNFVATKKRIMDSVMSTVKESQKKPLDTFIFMFAGHGIPDGFQGKKTNSFLAPSDAIFNEFHVEGGGFINNETFINKAWLIKQLSAINAKTVIMILDSCYSGTKDFGERYAENMGFRIESAGAEQGKRGIMIVKKGDINDALGKKIAFIASSRDDQQSAEYEDLKHGALSYAIFEYLRMVRQDVEVTDVKVVSLESVFSNIVSLFDSVKVDGVSLSEVHQPVMFTLPDYETVKGEKFLAMRGIKAPAPKVTEKPKARIGFVKIESDYSGVEILVDGETTGHSIDQTFSLTEGKHMISLYINETSYTHNIVVEAADGISQTVTVSLKGNVEVKTYAEKAGQKPAILDVYIDDKYTGQSPFKLSGLVAGTHTIKVVAEGVTKERKIEVRPDSPLLVKYKIIRKPVVIQDKDDDDGGVGSVTF
ncbi:MAG: caspase family protein [Thermodesulfobacteriota bacterium]